MTLKEFSDTYFHPMTDQEGSLVCSKDYFAQFLEQYDLHREAQAATRGTVDASPGDKVFVLLDGKVEEAELGGLSYYYVMTRSGEKLSVRCRNIFTSREAAKEYVIAQALAKAGLE